MLRIATFNLLHGMSLSPTPDPDERLLREAVKSLDADVVGVQEVDRLQPRSGCVDQTAIVAAAMGAEHARFVPALMGTPGGTWSAAEVDDGATTAGPSYGIGLVSRLPVREWRVRRFPPSRVALPLLVPGGRRLARVADEPRLALAGVLETPVGPVTVVTAHLSFVPGRNVRQLRSIVRWTADLPRPLVLAGDLNLPGPLPRITTRWTRLATVPTYPSYRPRVQFDHVLGDGVRSERVRRVEAAALPLSDHCALTVDLEI